MNIQDDIDSNYEISENPKIDELKYWNTIIVKLKNKKMSSVSFHPMTF